MKYHTIPVIYISVLIALLFVGCGIAGRKTAAPDTEMSGEEFDPFRYGDEFLDVRSPAASATGSEMGNASSETLRGSDTAGSDEAGSRISRETYEGSVYGYRVQIGIDQDKERMEQLAQKARDDLDMNVYLEFEAPFYRVRVGDFRTREEAEKNVRMLKNAGFKDALWVMSEINLH